MTTPVTGRQRASRIPLDYFKTPSLWERRKLLATLAVGAAAAAWWTVGILMGRQNANLHSPGTLASVHSTWQSQCSACHAPFRAIRGDAVGTLWEGGTPVSDQKCQACHQGAPHHPLKQGELVPGCSSCHQDHQGIEASLLRMDDRACTSCHGAIEQHTAGKTTLPPDSASVKRFDQEHHPDFSISGKDPGRLIFSHARHMTPGMVMNPESHENAFTLDQIDPSARERYRRLDDTDSSPVRLDCGSCHQVDGGDFKLASTAGLVRAALPARPAGRYMLPITYENQCQACHPLYDKKAPGVLPAIVRHGQSPSEIQQTLHREFAEEFLKSNPQMLGLELKKSDPPEPLPNVRQSENQNGELWIREKMEVAQSKLSQEYCGKCHELASAEPGLQPVIPTKLRQVWYEHAKFDHSAHRAMECDVCHSLKSKDPLPRKAEIGMGIPARDLCLKCHAPLAQSESATTGGARFDCAECHRYHNGNAPLAGSGAEAESPMGKLSEREFHSGR